MKTFGSTADVDLPEMPARLVPFAYLGIVILMILQASSSVGVAFQCSLTNPWEFPASMSGFKKRAEQTPTAKQCARNAFSVPNSVLELEAASTFKRCGPMTWVDARCSSRRHRLS